jgi:N-acyl homoserine lactone hydrolase
VTTLYGCLRVSGDAALGIDESIALTGGASPSCGSHLIEGTALSPSTNVSLTRYNISTHQIFVTDTNDEPAIRRSTRKISDMAEHENVKLMNYGHDAQLWATIRQSPTFYE